LHPAVELPHMEVRQPDLCTEAILERVHLSVQHRNLNLQSGHDLQNCPILRLLTVVQSTSTLCALPGGNSSAVPVAISLTVDLVQEKRLDDIEVSLLQSKVLIAAYLPEPALARCRRISLQFLCEFWTAEVDDVSLLASHNIVF
jgi:hypothetical protein